MCVISNLISNLTIIYIRFINNKGGNKLTWEIPNDPENMTYLSNLLLSKCFFYTFLSKFVFIIFLIVISFLSSQLDDNKLMYSIPASFCNLETLRVIRLGKHIG